MSESATRHETDVATESIDREVQFDPIALLDAGNVIVTCDAYNDTLLTKRDGQIHRHIVRDESVSGAVSLAEDTARRNVRQARGTVEIYAENPYDV